MTASVTRMPMCSSGWNSSALGLWVGQLAQTEGSGSQDEGHRLRDRGTHRRQAS